MQFFEQCCILQVAYIPWKGTQYRLHNENYSNTKVQLIINHLTFSHLGVRCVHFIAQRSILASLKNKDKY